MIALCGVMISNFMLLDSFGSLALLVLSLTAMRLIGSQISLSSALLFDLVLLSIPV